MRRRNWNFLAGILAAAACSGDPARTTPARDTASLAHPAAAPADQSSRPTYVGSSYTSLPDSVKSVGGAVLPSGADAPGNYALDRVATPRGEMIWLDAIGATSRTVRAELRLPPLARDERLLIGSCDVGRRLDPRVIAIVVNEPNVARFTKVRQAWRVDVRGARFEILPVSGIVCEDPDSASR